MRISRFGLAALVLLNLAGAAFAVQPEEMLPDAAQEARARHISAGLRCLVCQNQSIDESDAGVAKDLRILIREQIRQNKSDDEVIAFVVDRYGDYVLLRPRFSGETLVLWLAPFAVLAAGAVFLLLRRPAKDTAAVGLSDTEKAQLEELVRK